MMGTTLSVAMTILTILTTIMSIRKHIARMLVYCEESAEMGRLGRIDPYNLPSSPVKGVEIVHCCVADGGMSDGCIDRSSSRRDGGLREEGEFEWD